MKKVEIANILFLLSFFSLFAESSFSQQVIYDFLPDPNLIDADLVYGRHVGRAGDVNADGYPDHLVAKPNFTPYGGQPAYGYVNVISGKNGAVLYNVYGSGGNAPPVWPYATRLGFGLATLGDVDQDGFDDFLVSEIGDEQNDHNGRIYLYSGKDGAEIYVIYEPAGVYASGSFGWELHNIGDIDGDTIHDFIVSDPYWDDFLSRWHGRALVYSGASGSKLYEYKGQLFQGLFAYATTALGDVSGDGVPDFAIGAPLNGYGQIWIHSGADGSLLTTWQGENNSTLLGAYELANAGDINQDGINDLLAPGTVYNGLTKLYNFVRLYSGADWSVLHEFQSNGPEEGFGAMCAGTGDMSGDGVADILISALWSTSQKAEDNEAGVLNLYSGKTFEFLYQWVGNSKTEGFGAPVISAGDTNLDGFADVLVGGHYTNEAFLFSGNDLFLNANRPTHVEGQKIRFSLSSSPGDRTILVARDSLNKGLVFPFFVDPNQMTWSGNSWDIEFTVPSLPWGNYVLDFQAFAVRADGSVIDSAKETVEVNICQAAAANGQDCNANGILDSCEINEGTSLDADLNGFPDECQLPIYVPQDYAKLQDALDAAWPGTTIWVEDGTYSGKDNENLDVAGKDLIIKSVNGPANCIIDLSRHVGAFLFNGGETRVCELDGFTIRNGGQAITIVYGSSPTIRNCIITNNQEGVTISGSGTKPLVENCLILNNGNGSAGVGGFDISSQAKPTIRNCLIAGNFRMTGYDGGGFFVWDGATANINHCTITDNHAEIATGSEGGGIFLNGATVNMNNCILRNNTAAQGTQMQIINGGVVNATYSNIEGGWPGIGNIDLDAQFVDFASQNYHLLPGSACINAGDPNYVVQQDEKDIDGETRIKNGRIDIGADELFVPAVADHPAISFR